MQNLIKVILKILATYLLLGQATPFMSCFRKEIDVVPVLPETPLIQIDQAGQPQATTPEQSQLRSYHPHYLNSLSYPQPITPHIYFAEVIGTQPLFSVKHLSDWDPKSIQILTVNGIELQDAESNTHALTYEETNRFMFVIQIQNSEPEVVAYSMNVFQREDYFLIVCQYRDQFNAFSLSLTRDGDPQKVGIKMNIRNESFPDARNNWRFTHNLRWRGVNNIANPASTIYGGFVLELELLSRSVKPGFRINLRELANPRRLSLQQFVKHAETTISSLTSSKSRIVRNSNCSNAAIQKVFDGLTYEYGTLRIKDGSESVPNTPKGLLSFSPSRTRFPWGFLWDDGFHCEVAVRKDEKLVLKVIKSWLDTMLETGWIPREQNRGKEREELCSCPRFMEKDVKDGNPPTLILALQYLRRKNRLTQDNFSPEYWGKIKKWYYWFITTQKDGESYFFRWKDSISQMGVAFTSGMDDFPRPFMAKANIDLQSWIYFFTKFMAETSYIYSESNAQYVSLLELLKENFKQFVDPSSNVYMDITMDGRHSQHFGYPSILPIAFGIPEYNSKEYSATIQKIIDQLDTGSGLSSISKKSSHYLRTQDAYWRGPVWINLNYMLLRGLKLHYPEQTKFYDKLRADLIKTVCGNWQQRGYFFQNYINGIGSFSFPFNGWTSLISIIYEQNY